MVLMFLAAGVAFLRYLFNKTKETYPEQTASVVSEIHESMSVVSRIGAVVDGMKFIQRAMFSSVIPTATVTGVAGAGTRFFGAQVAADVVP